MNRDAACDTGKTRWNVVEDCHLQAGSLIFACVCSSKPNSNVTADAEALRREPPRLVSSGYSAHYAQKFECCTMYLERLALRDNQTRLESPVDEKNVTLEAVRSPRSDRDMKDLLDQTAQDLILRLRQASSGACTS